MTLNKVKGKDWKVEPGFYILEYIYTPPGNPGGKVKKLYLEVEDIGRPYTEEDTIRGTFYSVVTDNGWNCYSYVWGLKGVLKTVTRFTSEQGDFIVDLKGLKKRYI
jgi:hypothetical protein